MATVGVFDELLLLHATAKSASAAIAANAGNTRVST
jgi:hypothetical protein